MDKATKYSINGALLLGSGNGLLNVIEQLDRINDTEQEFDWNELLASCAKGALLGGTGGYLLGSFLDHQKASEQPINTNHFFASLVNDTMLSYESREYKRLDKKAIWLTQELSNEFNDLFSHDIIRLGSTEKGTALNYNFDIDLYLSFKLKSFKSLEEMYEEVFYFLEELEDENDIIKIRRQKKSIGVIFNISGKEYKIDIIPSRKTSKSKNDGKGYLYLKNDDIFTRNSYTKTDIKAIQSFVLTPTQKKIVVIFKNWKRKNDVPISSHLIQTFVKDAYELKRGYLPKTLTGKILCILDHIYHNMDMNIVSIENTNNILTDLSDLQISKIKNACKDAIEEYKYHPNDFIELFDI